MIDEDGILMDNIGYSRKRKEDRPGFPVICSRSLYSPMPIRKIRNADTVKLMTIHAAKGLEFSCVFAAGLEESLFPNAMSINTREELEEERRLFYVVITRAKHKLWITYANSAVIVSAVLFKMIPAVLLKKFRKISWTAVMQAAV